MQCTVVGVRPDLLGWHVMNGANPRGITSSAVPSAVVAEAWLCDEPLEWIRCLTSSRPSSRKVQKKFAAPSRALATSFEVKTVLGGLDWPHDNFTRFVGQWKDQTAFNISQHALH